MIMELLQDIDLEVDVEILGIIGKNGAGKLP
jgi:ABC-type Mn2+/Zn2+ transport system ATPase subunit